MPVRFVRPRSAGMLFVLTVLGVLNSGCGGDGLSEYDRMKLAKDSAASALRAKGVQLEEKRYPQGDAWSVKLAGQEITDETFEQLKSLKQITELDFSGSTLSDAHAAKLNAMEVSGFLLKLDVSKTSFSDAGLAELTGLNLLRELIVTGSKVTKAGIDKFQQARQNNPSIMVAFRKVNVKQ